MGCKGVDGKLEEKREEKERDVTEASDKEETWGWNCGWSLENRAQMVQSRYVVSPCLSVFAPGPSIKNM